MIRVPALFTGIMPKSQKAKSQEPKSQKTKSQNDKISKRQNLKDQNLKGDNILHNILRDDQKQAWPNDIWLVRISSNVVVFGHLLRCCVIYSRLWDFGLWDFVVLRFCLLRFWHYTLYLTYRSKVMSKKPCPISLHCIGIFNGSLCNLCAHAWYHSTQLEE